VYTLKHVQQEIAVLKLKWVCVINSLLNKKKNCSRLQAASATNFQSTGGRGKLRMECVVEVIKEFRGANGRRKFSSGGNSILKRSKFKIRGMLSGKGNNIMLRRRRGKRNVLLLRL